jgi:tetratricopeptide (TPR) repeat protein
VLVVAAALLVGLLVGFGDDHEELSAWDTPSATDELSSERLSGSATLAPAGFASPAREEWTALLPRLQEAVAANSDDRNAQRKLALAYYNLGRLDEARVIYEGLLRAEEDPVLRNRMGNILRDLGEAAGAEEAYRRAIAEDATLAPPYLNLAELLWRNGQLKQALAVLDQGIKAVPEESRAALQSGRDFLRKQE